MATAYESVVFSSIADDGRLTKLCPSPVSVRLATSKHETAVNIYNGNTLVQTIQVNKETETAKVGSKGLILSTEGSSRLLCFSSLKDQRTFEASLKNAISSNEISLFTQRTDSSSAEQYFQFYGYMSQQQNMMQDYIRTATYQRAMLDNMADFQDKVVLDVGAGSGILSFFAIQAGARRVYAIEASSMVQHCQTLVQNNKLSDQIIVIAGKIEEIVVPEKVDVIISEPMGYMLFNERMLETYLHAKKWLKPGGKMFPTQGELHLAPFTDETLYIEQCSKANFWYQNSFHSVDLSSLREAAVQEYFRQPVVDTFDIRSCLAKSQKYTVDFQTAHETDLHRIEIPVSFVVMQSGTIHGLAFWFDVAFLGSQSAVWLSTAPTQPLTHWYQVRCLLQTPIFAKQNQTLVGKVLLKANTRQSYDVEISLAIPGTTIKSSNVLDLKNPYFRYTGQAPQPPPGNNHTSPTDGYWNQQDVNVAVQPNEYNVALFNGAMGDGSQLLQMGHAGNIVYNSIVPLGNIAPIHPGSIPSPGIGVSSIGPQALQTRTSVGGGISPILMTQGVSTSGGNQLMGGAQYMLGDYMLPSNSTMPSSLSHGLGLMNFKGSGQL